MEYRLNKYLRMTTNKHEGSQNINKVILKIWAISNQMRVNMSPFVIVYYFIVVDEPIDIHQSYEIGINE